MRRALDLPKVCEALSVSPSTLYKLVSAGEFPRPFRIGKTSRWSSDDVDEYVARKSEERAALAPRPATPVSELPTHRGLQ